MKNISKIKRILSTTAIIGMMTTGMGYTQEPIKLVPSGEVIEVNQDLKFMYVTETLGDTLLKKDDIIIEIGDPVTNTPYQREDLKELYKQEDKNIVIIYRRDSKIHQDTFTAKDLRNVSLSGNIGYVGTVTAIDENGNFVGLSHNVKIAGLSLNNLIIGESSLTEVDYLKDNKGRILKPGNLEPIMGDDIEGSVTSYGEYSIKGKMKAPDKKEKALEVAKPKEGKAYIYCKSPISNELKMHEIEITEVNEETSKIKVIDKTLLKYRGGIVRGMSGSPVIQDGKIVGGIRSTSLLSTKTGMIANIHSMLENTDFRMGDR